MHPVIFQIGPVTIYSYGLMIALGIVVGLALARRQAGREGIAGDKIVDITFYCLLAAFIGARLGHILLDLHTYLAEPLAILKIWEGGLLFYGGLIPAVAVGIWYIKHLRLPLWQVADIFAPSIAIGHAFGRIGCFLAGCCYGTPTDLPWGVTFTHPRTLAPQGIPLHPTQLYSAFALLMLFVLLVWLRKRKAFHGELFWTYSLCFAVGRFFVEFLRGDDRGTILSGLLSATQGISILLAGISTFMFLYLRRKGHGCR